MLVQEHYISNMSSVIEFPFLKFNPNGVAVTHCSRGPPVVAVHKYCFATCDMYIRFVCLFRHQLCGLAFNSVLSNTTTNYLDMLI